MEILATGGQKLTVVVQLRGPGDQHKEEKCSKTKPHAKQLCRTERENITVIQQDSGVEDLTL